MAIKFKNTKHFFYKSKSFSENSFKIELSHAMYRNFRLFISKLTLIGPGYLDTPKPGGVESKLNSFYLPGVDGGRSRNGN